MTVADAGEIFAYWSENPPAHLLLQTIARMLGWKPVADEPPPISQIVAMAPPGLAMAPNGDIGMPAPILDIATLRALNRARLANRSDRL